MKCKLIRTMKGINPAFRHDAYVDFLATGKVQAGNAHCRTMSKPAGTEIDHPQAFRLVQNGVAIPADDECAARCGMTPADIRAAKQAYEKVSRGIAPQDYGLYDRGVIVGYNPDGSYKPGPNYSEDEIDEHEAENEDDEE